MHSSYTGRRGERGFTLIELMYATAYFMIGLAGLASFQIIAANGTQHASDITLATNLATAVLETYRAGDSSTLLAQAQPVVTTYDRFGTPNAQPTYFTVSTNAAAPFSASGFYDVTVNASWAMGATDTFVHSVTMQTRIATP